MDIKTEQQVVSIFLSRLPNFQNCEAWNRFAAFKIRAVKRGLAVWNVVSTAVESAQSITPHNTDCTLHSRHTAANVVSESAIYGICHQNLVRSPASRYKIGSPSQIEGGWGSPLSMNAAR